MCPREHMGEFPTTFDSTLNPAYGKFSTIPLTHSCTGQRRILPISMNVGREIMQLSLTLTSNSNLKAESQESSFRKNHT